MNRYVGRDLARFRRGILRVLACTIVAAAARVVTPLLARVLLDSTLRGRPAALPLMTIAPADAVLVVPGLILLVTGMIAAAHHFLRRWALELGQRFVGHLQVQVFEHLLRLPAVSLERQALGQQMSRFSGDMTALRRFVSRSLPEILRDTVAILAVGVALLVLDGWLGLAVVTIVAAYLTTVMLIGRRLRPASRALRSQRARVASMVLDRLSTSWIVKLTARERAEATRLARRQRAVLAATRRSATLSGLMSGAAEVAVGVALAVALGLGARAVVAGVLTHGEMVAFYGLVLLLVSPLRTISRTTAALAEGSVSLERAYALLARAAERDLPGAQPLVVTRGEIILREVRAERWRQGVTFPDLRIAPGVTAILGGPASGKTTLGHLLVGLARPTSGMIEIDGADVAAVTLASLRRAVMYIPQTPTLLKGTVRLNLRAGLAGISPPAMLEALRAAGAIWATPAALDRKVGGAGRRLSPSQRWQVLCARALLARPAILVLDGPAADGAALDTLLRALQQAGVRTVLLLCDRAPTSAVVDRTVDLEPAVLAAHG